MKNFILLLILLAACTPSKEKDTTSKSFETIHQEAIVVDTHNDILMHAVDNGVIFDTDLTGQTHSDLQRWRKGGLDVQIFSVYCDGALANAFAMANREMDSLDAVVQRDPDKIAKVANSKELLKAVEEGKIAAMFGVEGGHMIEDDLQKLDSLYARGAIYLSLTHNVSPNWVSSAADESADPNLPEKGLTAFGEEVVQRMNELGMLIDVSHSGDQSFWDVIKLSTKPIIASHSSVYSLVAAPRNLKDDQIKAIAKNGGVIQINFHPGFIDPSFDAKEAVFLQKHAAESDSLLNSGNDEWNMLNKLYKNHPKETEEMRPPLSMVIDHIDYIVQLVGVDYVGLGSDFDGIVVTPKQLDDVTTYPVITEALFNKGYSQADIKKILGGNFLRVMKSNE